MFAIAAMLMQIPAPGPENWAFVSCLTARAERALGENPGRADFPMIMATACPSEATALHRVAIAKGVSEGLSEAQSREQANRLIWQIRAVMLDLQP